MKRILLPLLAAITLFTGCAKEDYTYGEGTLRELTFTASLPELTLLSKSDLDIDGDGSHINRCVMEIYHGEQLFLRQYALVSDKAASFCAQLVSNRTYVVAFWADCVDNPGTDAGLSTDKYYSTTSLKSVTFRGDYSGNEDERDAFCNSAEFTIGQDDSSRMDIQLKRPFAQINVITTDLASVPTEVSITVKKAYTTLNVITDQLSGQQDLSYTAQPYNFPILSMDYIFASNENSHIDMEFKAKKLDMSVVFFTFTNTPYLRNFRTNVKGNL